MKIINTVHPARGVLQNAVPAVLVVAAAFPGLVRAEEPPTTPAMNLCAVYTKPPEGIPTGTMPDGPLLGNGDVGIVMSGSPEEQRFYVGKNDFWRRNDAAVMNVGMLTVAIPELKGASYRQEQDMALAEVRGAFTNGDVAVRTRSFVDANSNLLVTELKCAGSKPVTASVMKGGARTDPPDKGLDNKVIDNDNKVNIGREQYQYLGNRWYFNGSIADAKVGSKVLSATEIADIAKAGVKESNAKVYNGTTFEVLEIPKMDSTVSVSAWIKAESYADTANYIVTKGEWNQSYSLGLSAGCLRWSINGFFLQSDKPLELKKWAHVAGTFESGKMSLYIDGKLVKRFPNERTKAAGPDAAILAITRKADNLAGTSREVAIVTRMIGGAPKLNEAGALSVTLKPGETAMIVSSIISDLDNPAFLETATKTVGALAARDISALAGKHRAWWKSFWSRSFIEIPDKEIEKRWYAALYVLGSCSRPGKVAPGLWGNWVTTDGPSWHGDFHLNYNFQAPYYMAYSGNHTDLTAPFYQAISEALPLGREMAKRRGWKGVHFPVCIGPWGLLPEGAEQDHGQRSNASYVSLNYIWQYQYTQDKEFLKKTAYPYLLEVAEFWEDYLKLEPIDAAQGGGSRYVIHRDAIHEGSGDNTNPILSLGVVRNLFKNLIVMSKDLGVDEARRAKWQDILDKLSAFPLQERNGKTVFRYTEKGLDWWADNTLGVQHIFPCDAIGLDSDPKLLAICHNTINEMARWADYNGFATWYTVCARVGYDPKIILTKLREECDKHSFRNLLLYYGGGGIESCGGFLVINEMLLQSHEGVLRFFPCWPKDQDARFGTLRAVGAFLVSAELKGGVVSGVKIISEKGKPCTVENPWPGKKVRVTRNGKPNETLTGERLSLKTAAGETIVIVPAER